MARKVQPDSIRVDLDVNATKAQEEIHKLTRSTEALQKQNAQYRKDISTLVATEGDHSKEIARLNEQIKANSDQIRKNNREISNWEKQIDTSYKTAAQLKKYLKKLKKELANTARNLNPERYRELEAEIKKTEKAYQEATKSSKGFLGGIFNMQKAVEALKGFFMGLGMVLSTQIIGQFSRLKDIIIDFERANSKLASVLGTNIDGIAKLTEQAKYLGRTTTATASEVTGLQTELAKLGFSQEIIEKMTPATLKFAKAVDTDLSSAAAFAGAALRMFNKDASDAEELMATFAVATTRSALDFHKLEASLATVGPVANAFGFSVEETTALLGILANAGFDASSAATATRNIILNLCDANGELAQALGKPVTNLDELVAGLNKLNAEGIDLAKALELTDKRSVAAFSSFLQGSDSLLELSDAITGATDDFNQMSDTMADNAFGAAKGFESAVEGLVLKFFDFRAALKSMFEVGTAVVQWFGELVDTLAATGTVLKALLTPIGLLLSALGSLVAWIAKLATQTRLGRAVINGIVTALLLASTATRTFMLNVVASSKAALVYVRNLALKAKALIADAAATVKAAIATRTFNAALMANPIMLVVGLIAMAISAFISYTDATEDATEKTNAWAEASREASKQYGEQKGKIEALILVANNENLSLQRRKKAVAELNKIIPGYNAKIDETTGKYRASKQALDEYLASLEKEMRYKANESKLQELTAAAEEARDAYDEAEIAAAKSGRTYVNWLGFRYNTDEQNEANKRRRAWNQAEADLKAFTQRMQTAINNGVIVPPSAPEAETVDTVLNNANEAATETVSRLKEINAELKKLRKINPESDEELDRIQKRIKLLQQEKKELLGNQKNKREVGTYREDSLDQATAPADEEHQRRMLDINKQKPFITEAEYTIKKNQELIRYCGELVAALETLRASTKDTHTQTLDNINQQQGQLALQVINAQQEINKAIFQRDRQAHTDRLNSLQDYYEENRIIVAQAVVDNRIQQDAANIYLMAQERQLHADQLAELERYYQEVKASDLIAGEEKQKTLDGIYKQIREAWSKTITDAGKWQQTLRELSTNTGSLEGIRENINLQIQSIEQVYTAVIKQARQQGLDVTRLEEEKQRRIAALNYQYLEEQYKTQEAVGLSWSDEYDRELEKLKNMHRQGLISEQNFQKARLNLQVKNVQKYYDYYAQLAGSMVSAIQEAEIAKSEAKYDVLIQQAKNNGEDTAALEEEKENKKLEIQKKYADVDFAIKVSQIIADTAVSAMKTYAQFGWPWGIIPAAMVSATGIAQIAVAKAERDKIKNMQPGNTGSSSKSTPTATRVLSGYSEGGYTGDGGRYEVAGVVHRGEYVVPMPIMEDPRVIDAVGTIEAIRQNKRLATGAAPSFSEGYAAGGPVTGQTSPATAELAEAVSDLRAATEAIRSLRAYVVFQDLEKAGQTLEAARAPFTRKK